MLVHPEQGWIYRQTQTTNQRLTISSALSLLTRCNSSTFLNCTDVFLKNFSKYHVLKDSIEGACFDLFFFFFLIFILISGWQKREDLNLKCSWDPMRNLFIFVCGLAVLSVVWHFNFLFPSSGGILISSQSFSFLHYEKPDRHLHSYHLFPIHFYKY